MKKILILLIALHADFTCFTNEQRQASGKVTNAEDGTIT